MALDVAGGRMKVQAVSSREWMSEFPGNIIPRFYR